MDYSKNYEIEILLALILYQRLQPKPITNLMPSGWGVVEIT
jgi:hypothetical protein